MANNKITYDVVLFGKKDSNDNIIERVSLLTNPSKVLSVEFGDNINIYVSYSGSIGDDIDIEIETSPDGKNFYKLSTFENTTVSTLIRNRKFKFVADSTECMFQIPLRVYDKNIKIKLIGSGDAFVSFKYLD